MCYIYIYISFFKAPQYKVTSQTGPPNNPTFTMVCTINGKSFNGEGKSKKEAKLACSQKAIEVCILNSLLLHIRMYVRMYSRHCAL